MTSIAAALATALAVLALGACGGHLQAFPGALRDWRAGHRARAVAAARAEVERWRAGNGLDEATLGAAVKAVDALFEGDVPVIVPGETSLAPPGESVDIDRGLAADLLSNRATAVVKAARSVERLALDRHGPELLTVIFRREPVVADGGLLAEASPALRSVAVKRLALRALEALASPKRPVL